MEKSGAEIDLDKSQKKERGELSYDWRVELLHAEMDHAFKIEDEYLRSILFQNIFDTLRFSPEIK